MPRLSLSALQSVVGLTTGVISIIGAAYTGMQLFSTPPSMGELVALVQDARTTRPLSDATVEVLTADNRVITTVRVTADGRGRITLAEGAFGLRVESAEP